MPLPNLRTRQRPLFLSLRLTILDPLNLQANNINKKKFTTTRKSPRNIRKNIMFRNLLIGKQRQHDPRET
jgi:hypothetical protein